MARKIRLFLLLFALAGVVSAQSVQIQVQLVPPYPTSLSEFQSRPNQVVISLINTTNQTLNVQLNGSLKGVDSDVAIATAPNYRSPAPVTLNPLQTRRLSAFEISQLFDASHLVYTGISREDILQKNGLPEGTYQLCIRAFDFKFPLQPLSSDEPQGCSNPILIQQLEPPYLIKPADGEELVVLKPQNALFTWSTPAGAPPVTEYVLKIAEMLNPDRNPNDVMLSQGAVFFEKPVKGNAYLFGPADPPLLPGRRYAVMVTARDPFGKTGFRNNGKSEVIAFTVRKTPEPYAGKGIQLIAPLAAATWKFRKGPDLSGDSDPFPFAWKAVPDVVEGDKIGGYFVRIVKVKPGVTPADAMLDAETRGSYTATAAVTDPNLLTYTFRPADLKNLEENQQYVWKVKAFLSESVAKNVYESDLRTFRTTETETPKIQLADIKQLKINGFRIDVAGIAPASDADHLAGHGTLSLKGLAGAGKINSFNVSFSGLAVRLISSGGGTPEYTVTRGEIHLTATTDLRYPFPMTDPELPGDYLFYVKSIDLIARLTVSSANGAFRIDQDNGTSTCKASVKWTSELWQAAGDKSGGSASNLIVESETTSLKIDPEKGLSGKLAFDRDRTDIRLDYPANFRVTFLKSGSFFELSEQGLATRLSGTVVVPDGRSDIDRDFTIYLTEARSLALKVPSNGIQIPLIRDGNTTFHLTFKEAFLRLSGKAPAGAPEGLGVGLTIPAAQLVWGDLSHQYVFELGRVLNNAGSYYNYNGPGKDGKQKMNTRGVISGFTCQMDKQQVTLAKSCLLEFIVEGNMIFPFFQYVAPFQFWVHGDLKGNLLDKGGYVDTDKFGETYLVGKAGSDQTISFKPTYVAFKNDYLFVQGNFRMTDPSGKGLACNKLYVDGLAVYPTGHVGAENGGLFYFSTQKNGTYRDFPYTFKSLVINKKDGTEAYQIKFSGTLTLADNLTPKNDLIVRADFERPAPEDILQTATFKDVITVDPGKVPKLKLPKSGPLPPVFEPEETGMGLTDDGVQIEHSDGVSSYKGKASYYLDDPVYGSGFRLETGCTVYQPDEKSYEAKVMIGRAGNAGARYSYWFFEAGATGVVDIPLFLNLVIYGFKGRIYYHMKHKDGKEGSIFNENYMPSADVGVGMYAEVPLKTKGDEGRIFWGKAAMEINTTSGGGIEKIRMAGEGNLLSPDGVGSAGQFRGSMKGEFNFQEKFFDLWLDVTGNLKGILCIEDVWSSNIHMDKNGFFVGVGYYDEEKKAWDYGIMNVMCAGFTPKDAQGGYLLISDKEISMGVAVYYDTGWKGISVKGTGVQGRARADFYANGTLQYNPFHFSAKIAASGSVWGRGCIMGRCLTKGAHIGVEMQMEAPDPVCLAGSIVVDVPVIPTFRLPARFKNGSFSFKKSCDD